MEGVGAISRFHRIYYAFLHHTTLTSGQSASIVVDESIQHSFGRPNVLCRLGQYIMSVKVMFGVAKLVQKNHKCFFIAQFAEEGRRLERLSFAATCSSQ